MPLWAAGSEAPWYEYEIIVFERLDKGAGSTESWPDNPGSPSRLNARPIKMRPAASSDGANPVPYVALPRSARRLNELWQRLRRSRNFRPQLHLAWRQPMVSPGRAQLLYIEMWDGPDARNPVRDVPKIEGTLKIGMRRYLHLETDLLLRRRAKSGPSLAQSDMQALMPAYQTYRLQTTRRMRSGKLHYLDHPVFGVLVLATRYVPPTSVEPEAPLSEESDAPPAEASETAPIDDTPDASENQVTE